MLLFWVAENPGFPTPRFPVCCSRCLPLSAAALVLVIGGDGNEVVALWSAVADAVFNDEWLDVVRGRGRAGGEGVSKRWRA